MRKIAVAVLIASLLIVATVSSALANPPASSCNGLDVAHTEVHGSGTQGELSLHDLRAADHCGH